MKTINLIDFFNKIGYNYFEDLEKIEKICYYTKTRVREDIKEFSLSYGCEQPFLIKAISEWHKASNFFEIGTGRGTACYSVSLVPEIKEILTVDILEFKQKFSTAIGYKKAYVSLGDIFDMIPFEEKRKITFKTRRNFTNLNLEKHFDICFIDGNHTDKNIILEDFNICQKLSKDEAFFIFDDYDPKKFAVKGVVDEILENNKDFNSLLVEFRGHIFDYSAEKEKDSGLVILKKGSGNNHEDSNIF